MRLAAAVIGLVVLTYWGRVLQMVLRQRRRTGRDANFVPPERLGRALRWVWAPVTGCWVAIPFYAALAKRPPAALRPLFAHPVTSWAGAAVAVLALFATFVCWRKMGRSWRMGIDPAERTPLIVNGPFAWVRHPIYALSSLLMLATMAALPSPVMLAVGVTHLLLLQWEARREEAHLLRAHGETYRRYLQATGRFLPARLHAYACHPGGASGD